MTVDPAARSPDDELCVAPGWDMLHTRECPHLPADALQALRSATADDLSSRLVCRSCRKVLDGARRTRFASFDAALEAYRAPVENRPRMREIAAELDFAEIWIPSSGSYIAVAPARGVIAVAYFNRGFVDVREDGGGYRTIELPTNWLRGGSGAAGVSRRLDDLDRAVCPTCFMQLTVSGACDSCS